MMESYAWSLPFPINTSPHNMFNEYDCIKLKKKIPNDDCVDVGTSGVILLILNCSPPVYEVEFTDSEGNNIGEKTYTLTEEYMELSS